MGTYTAGEQTYSGWCPFFCVYADLDALQAEESDLSEEDRYRADRGPTRSRRQRHRRHDHPCRLAADIRTICA
ncbi:hypothetical protein [Nocardia abscessus]|uniref:hypothetical protein n=1 Tax=Nocardia abscessus TaxID=120957 RepID=UPI002458120D|nr:hypothetical protein [Nocardia abscessus]